MADHVKEINSELSVLNEWCEFNNVTMNQDKMYSVCTISIINTILAIIAGKAS